MKKPPHFETKITQMFGIKYPIFAAPMFLVSNEDMVTAATNAGGLGTFPALNFRPIENYRKAIQNIKSKSQGPFGINIIVQKSNSAQQKQIEIALEEEVPLIITSLGSPKDIIKKAQGTKTKVFCDVVGLKHAKKVADMGADGLIAVGSGAGGHAGDTSLFALIPFLKKQIDLPLIAAGSICDGPTMHAAMALGADAVYMGTRMIASKEAQVSTDYKQAIVGASSEDIINTDKVDGFPGNFIRTSHLDKLLNTNIVERIVSHNKRVKRWISLARAGRALFASKDQKYSYKTIFSAGHGVSLIDEVLSIEEIIEQTMHQYYESVGSLK